MIRQPETNVEEVSVIVNSFTQNNSIVYLPTSVRTSEIFEDGNISGQATCCIGEPDSCEIPSSTLAILVQVGWVIHVQCASPIMRNLCDSLGSGFGTAATVNGAWA